ncbi:MAG TPA: M1 family aminopeptidase [Thermoanaerobaculia bacterium]|nr:M1 family aminopeptidase [Thermoanaerobaculia bacterium]
MLSAIYRFEVRYHLRHPLFYICFVLFFLLTFGGVTSDSVQIGGAIGNVHRNAPFVIMQFLIVMSTIGVFPTTAFVANSIFRDTEFETESLFFSTPIRKRDYLLGRFLGSFTVSALIYVGVVLAIMIGSLMPWLETERLGPFTLAPYLFSFLVLIIPNLLLSGAIFFAVTALTRSMAWTYTAVVGFFVGYAIAGSFLGDLENEALASLLDPFGFGAFALSTKYWTVFERNTALLPLRGVFLYNRLIWMGLALAILAFTFSRFRMEPASPGKSKRRKILADDAAGPAIAPARELPVAAQRFGAGASWVQWRHATWLELSTVLKSLPFLVILFLATLNLIGGSEPVDQLFGTPIHPVTHLMLQVIEGSFFVFALILVTFYAGEMVWRQKSLKLHEVYDAMPVPNIVLWGSKAAALGALVIIVQLWAMATAIGIQTFRGYHRFEIPLYLKGLFLDSGVTFLLLAILAFFVQVITSNKFLGFLVMVLFFVSTAVLPAMHLEHHLYSYATTPANPYSDMNGYGHFARAMAWFDAYWAMFALLLLVVGHLLWPRGTETSLRSRWREGLRRFTTAPRLVAAVGLILFVALGCWIFYNTNILNHYVTSEDIDKRAADFEKKYKRYEGMDQPRITDVQAAVDIRPEKRELHVQGRYTLVNKSGAPIRDLHLTINPDVTEYSTSIPGSSVTMDDRRGGYRILRLSPPLAPGATLPMSFEVDVRNHGFENGHSNTDLVANGTFVNNSSYFPHIGYDPSSQLQDRNKRRKNGLGPVERLPKVTDMKARMRHEVSAEGDWINLDTTVSTAPDQIALAPGYLQREWLANGRRYFHYKTEAPILPFWSYVSARYQVRKSTWKGIPLEVYYDAQHAWNVDRMIEGMQKSLDYYTVNFSPYQHRQLRILEFPRYQRFAQSFPNTIPFSESIGFIANLKDPNAIDYVFYVTAHEVGHQWWAHQVVGAGVQGTTMITETLAQYSALMVMEKEYGPQKMRRFLKYELNRYLRGRGGELVEEMPLELVENQTYIHYGKGSLIMYALRDLIGDRTVNAVLAGFIHDHAFKGPPYPVAPELVERFKQVTPAEKRSAIHDWFETITLYDNRATEATAVKQPDGQYKVHLVVESKKLRDEGKGQEKEIAVDDFVDVGVFGAAPAKQPKELGIPLVMQKLHITQPRTVVDWVVKGKPARAGIDPYNKLIDRNPDDNAKDVGIE